MAWPGAQARVHEEPFPLQLPLVLGLRQRRRTANHEAGGSNWQNFIDAVRAGKREMLNAEIEEGALPCTLMHYGDIANRLGRTLEIDPATGNLKNDPEANRMFTRDYRAPFVVPRLA